MGLKIVILGPAHPFRGGGITTFNERLAKELQEQGHQVSILNFTVQYPSFLFPGKSQLTDEPAPAGISIERKLHSMNPLNWIGTGFYLKKKRPDLIIVRFWLPLMGPAFGTVLRMVKKNHHTRIIAITDNVKPHEKRPGDKPFTGYFLKPCDAFITMSEKVLADLKEFNVHQPALKLDHPLYDNFGPGVGKDEARRWLGIPSDKKLLLFFGFIRKYKGLDLLLQACKELADKDILLVVAGEFYEDEAVYQALIDSLGIRDRVILKNDFIPNEEVKYYFSAADVVVQPYRNATQSGVTPLAYHFEKPMIVTNVGALPDYVPNGRTGIVTEPEPASIARAIEEFFRFGEEHYKSQIRIEKQKFSWQSFSAAILNLYQKITARN
ncbi:glycosyltransferase [Flavihumibacter stibioxidans]|uniref:Glycosyl transferase family 1 n=1 Tax=Flavihumibacter stibioxidans TaxID=1834163 RepID=A0ABR7M333_9BACT|nr:glycosyltransferase [Flavihumibacter stibioxidans]MBC6489435.1 glycosyl transferase family 1 [Flavihumibacter stibioxidans]